MIDWVFWIVVIFLLTVIFVVAPLSVYFLWRWHHERNKLFADIIKGSGDITEVDVTDENKTFDHGGAEYVIENDRIATRGDVIRKKRLTYLEGFPEPIWFPESSMKQKNADPDPDPDSDNGVTSDILIDGYELYNLLRPSLSADILEVDEGWDFNIGKKTIIILVVVVIVLGALAFYLTGGSETAGAVTP